jgi:hypothetical protein
MSTAREVHPYFTDKARDVFTKAGGDPDVTGPLARWAQDHKGKRGVGVIVAEDGTLVAETRHVDATDSTPGATYVTRQDASRLGMVWHEVDLAMAELQHRTGRRHIHVKVSEVTQGAGTGRAGQWPDLAAAAAESARAEDAAGVARDRLYAQIRAAVGAGLSKSEASRISGITRPTIDKLLRA